MTATTRSVPTTRPDAFLRFALRLDAVLTGLAGVAGLALAPRIAQLCGTTAAFEYASAAAFVAYGLVVYGLSTRRRVATAGAVVAVGNVVFTVAAVAVVLIGVWPLSTVGIVAFLGAGVYTLVMAELQYQGLRRLAR